MNYGLQLYTMRNPGRADLDGMLKRVAEMGYQYVQWSGLPDLSAGDIRDKLDAAGLEAKAGHVGLEAFENDFEAAVAHWKTIGVTDVAVGGMMRDCVETRQDWLRGAKRLEAAGAKLREAGLRLSYHNHAHEFEHFPGDDVNKLDLLMDATDPMHLFAELDTAWVQAGGADPAAYIRKYAGRCPVVHFKDLAPDAKPGAWEFGVLGAGQLDWDDILTACAGARVEWAFYEDDNAGDPFANAEGSLAWWNKQASA